MAPEKIQYLLFDIESISDPFLVAAIRRPGEEVDPEEALTEYRQQLMETKGSDFVPYTFQVPVSLALAKIRSDYTIAGLGVLKCEDGGPGKISRDFWRGWEQYGNPTFVTYNGRGFDIPLMELAAVRYGIPVPAWFSSTGTLSPRYRFNQTSHIDLYSFFTNFGATSMTGGLNLMSKLLRKPGKMETHGDMVQDMFAAGRLSEIHSYCRCDVLDTYFVFLRYLLICGKITPNQETELTEQARKLITDMSEEFPIYKTYLEMWDQALTAPSLDDYLAQKTASAE